MGSVFLSLADPSRTCDGLFIRHGAAKGGEENKYSRGGPSQERRVATPECGGNFTGPNKRSIHPRELVRYEPRTAVTTPFAKSLWQSAEVENGR